MEDKTQITDNGWKPRVVAFVCNWCTYAGADLAGTSRMHYDASVRMIRVPCSGRVDYHLILKAFEKGADAVLVSGCHPGDCHYDSGNYHARRRFAVLRAVLDFLGIEQDRLFFSWISAAEAIKFVDLINDIAARVRELGPFEKFERLRQSTQQEARDHAG